MLLNHHAPWRLRADLAKGDLSPAIYDETIFNPIKQLYGASARFILATCNIEYLLKFTDRLSAYEASSSNIPYLIGIYAAISDEENIAEKLQLLKTTMKLNKIFFFIFTSKMLHDILENQESLESRWDYKINYIRSARFNIVPSLWRIFGLSTANHAISDSSIYIVDLDNIISGDINHSVKKQYGNKKLIFSWNSAQTQNKDFPKTFTGITVGEKQYHHDSLYTIVKAGFSIFAPSPQSNIFLSLFKNYSIGLTNTNASQRLFSFYFSDLLAITLALIDLKNSNLDIYNNSIDWIDLHDSFIANLGKEKSPLMYCPKGLE